MNDLEEQTADWIIGLPNKYFYSQRDVSHSKEIKQSSDTYYTPKEILEELDLYLNWVGSLK